MVPDEPDEPDPGTNVAMPAVRHDSHAEHEDESAHEKSQSIDIQFSSQSLPVAKGKPGARRPRPKTIPDRIAESLTHIPVVKEVIPKSRKGRVLVRSVIVAFALIAAWISVIVYVQLRGQEKPDFRPQVEAIFVQLRDGHADQVYAESSQRFQELMVQDAFETQVEQMNEVLGRFVEVASVIKTEMPPRTASGRTARVEVLLEFERGRARAAISFHREGKVWRMMGYGVDVPPEIAAEEGTQERRQARVQDKELVDELRALTDRILGQSREGKAGAIWDEAALVFRQSITRTDFIALEQERHDRLGPYNRILAVTTASTNPSKTAGSLDLLIEFRHPQGGSATTTGVFKYEKDAGVWKLTFYKLIMPLPRDREPDVE